MESLQADEKETRQQVSEAQCLQCRCKPRACMGCSVAVKRWEGGVVVGGLVAVSMASALCCTELLVQPEPVKTWPHHPPPPRRVHGPILLRCIPAAALAMPHCAASRSNDGRCHASCLLRNSSAWSCVSGASGSSATHTSMASRSTTNGARSCAWPR